MVEVEPLNQVERTAIVERFFKHEKFKRAEGFASCEGGRNRVVALDFAYNKDGVLRLSVYLKGRELDRVFRSVEDVFDGWDCFYWMEIPESHNTERFEQIESGMSKLFVQLCKLIENGDTYWFIIKNVDHFYEFS